MENCGSGNMNATYIYMPLIMDLFGRLFFGGLPEKVWVLKFDTVAIQALGKQPVFPSESLRGSVFLKQADYHLLNGVF